MKSISRVLLVKVSHGPLVSYIEISFTHNQTEIVMRSQQASNLLTMVAAINGNGVVIAHAAARANCTLYSGMYSVLGKHIKELAQQIIAGQYPTLRNTMEPTCYDWDDMSKEEDVILQDEEDAEQPIFGNPTHRVKTGRGHMDGGVLEYVSWFSDGEDTRCEE